MVCMICKKGKMEGGEELEIIKVDKGIFNQC